MSQDAIRLSYNAQLCRVRCEVSRAQACLSDSPPYDIVNRARAKLDSLKKIGEIDFYTIYETRLGDVWRALQQAPHLPDTYRCTLTLGAGAHTIPNISLDPPLADKSLGSLTAGPLTGPTGQWSFEFFKLNVCRKLRDLGIRDQPHDAQLAAMWFRLQRGESLQAIPISSVHILSQTGSSVGRPYAVLASKQRLDVSILIRSLQELATKEQRDSVLNIVQQAVTQLAQEGVQFTIFKKDVSQAIQAALEGPEGLGLEMPITLLAAMGTRSDASLVAPETSGKTAPLIQSNYPGAGSISFIITPDRMEAAIDGFQETYYADSSFKVDLDWISKELKRSGIAKPIPADAGKILSDAIAKKASLNGLVACRGKSGVGGKGPYLFHSYKEASERIPQANLDKDSLDIRDLQNRSTVIAGQLVAEIRYKDAPQEGEDIYGAVVGPPPSEELALELGVGIEQKDGSKFYALEDGSPNFEDNTISISRTMIHKGDVNLRTGNIRFPGPVEIHGSVDQGAVVDVKGDLLIHGEVRGAEVRSRGNIIVKSGVTTGTTGIIQCRGDFRADFVESSRIFVAGNIAVKKAILNSQVACGGTIQTLGSDSTIGGGHIISRDSLSTANLGFRHGTKTILDVGVDYRVMVGLEIREGRIKKLEQKAQEDRQALREIVQRSKAQLTPRHVQIKEELQERITRIRTIVEKLELIIQHFKSRLTFSSTAQVYVRGILAPNLSLEIAGQKIAVLNEVAAVCVSSKRRRGSYIIPLEEVLKEEEESGISPFADSKKAS